MGDVSQMYSRTKKIIFKHFISTDKLVHPNQSKSYLTSKKIKLNTNYSALTKKRTLDPKK